MSIIKSFSVGYGDMFYIDHNSDNFTMIDCNLTGENKNLILSEISRHAKVNGITRFISTHPDLDHLRGLHEIDDNISLCNFYCVCNDSLKGEPQAEYDKLSFKRYFELRDCNRRAFYVKKDCNRKWMNQNCIQRGSSGLNILWPDVTNHDFKDQLQASKEGASPNNICPIITYKLENNATFMWMGDLESAFLEKIEKHVKFEKVNILFAPHHGRDSAKVPSSILAKLDPNIIIIGEASSDHLNYYNGYNTIKQNSAGDITFELESSNVNIYTSNENYGESFLTQLNKSTYSNYIGSITITK